MGKAPQMTLVELSSDLRTRVANEGRITNAKSLMTSISGKTKVEMSGIQESDITVFEKAIPSNLSAVPETMKLHQVTSSRIRYVNRNI